MSFFNKTTHGYFLAKKFFIGKFKREVFLTLYDIKLNKSCYGYLFLSDGKVLMTIIRDLSDLAGVYELEKNDLLLVVDDQDIQTVINTGIRTERYHTVTTTNPIAYLSLNNKYILLASIQSNKIGYGFMFSGAYSATYLTEKNYIPKLKNLLLVIQTILSSNKADFELPLHGLSSFWSKFNLCLVILIPLIGFPIVLYLILFG